MWLRMRMDVIMQLSAPLLTTTLQDADSNLEITNMKDPEKIFIILEIAGGIVAAILIIIGLAIKAETWFFSLPSIEFTLFMLAGWVYKRIYDKKKK